MSTRLSILTLLVVLAPPSLARAQAPGQETQQGPSQAEWYRGSMLIADAAAVGITAYFVTSTETNRLWDLAPAGIAFAALGPAVHWAHGNPRGALNSVALRVGLPALGGFLGWLGWRCTTCTDGNNDLEYEVLGGLAGMGVAMIIDDGFLAHKPSVERPTWAPIVAPAPRGSGATFGLARSF